MIKYQTRFNEIKQVEVEKETANSVWIDGKRYSKIAQYQCYFDTFEQAKDYLLKDLFKDLNAAQLRVKRLSEEVERVTRLIP